MIAFYMIFLCFVVLPIVSAVTVLSAAKHRFVLTGSRNNVAVKVKSLEPEVYAAGAVLFSIFNLFILAGYVAVGGVPPGWLIGTVFTLVVVCTLALSIILFRATRVYALCPTIFKWLGSLVSVLVVFASNVYADAFIAQRLGIAGTELVAAQRVLTIIFLPVMCAFLLSWAMLPLYGVAGLLWLWHTFTDQTAEQQRRRFVMLGGRRLPLEKSKANIYMILFASLAFATLIPINAVSIVTQNHVMDRIANNAVVWASFHLDKNLCFPEAVEGTVFALINSDRVAAATPDERLAYTYQVKDCEKIKNGDSETLSGSRASSSSSESGRAD